MFLNPLMLIALAGISAPILVHLLNRRRIQQVRWAAMRFLQNAVKQNQRRMNIEDLLLLALRCLLVALIALAMARPAVRSPISSILGQTRVAAVLVLDNSASTALSDGVISRFDQSKKIATEIISGLPRGSSVAVYLASDVATPLIAEPTSDLVLARQAVDQALRSDRPTNLLPVITQASAILANQSSLRKELYLVTDGQAIGLRQANEIDDLLQHNKGTIRTTFVLDGIPESHNLAVTGFKLGDAQFPVQNQAVSFDVQVTNFGAGPVTDVPVTLGIDHQPAVAESRIDAIPAGESRTISLSAKFRDEGYRTIVAQIPHDRMPADDQRTLALRVAKQLQVLLVTSDPSPDSRDSATYFLREALVPVAPAERDSYSLRTRTIAPQQLESTRLADFAVVVLADAASMPPAAVESLTRYVSAGGGLLVFPGGRSDARFYNDHLAAGLLPAKLGAIRGNLADTNKFLTLQSGDYTHPIVSLWSDPKAGTLSTARFFRSYLLTPGESNHGSPITTILRFSDGSPAMVSRRIGTGEVILLASTADTAWNDFPVRPAYLPLLFRTVGQLMQHRDESLNLRVGDAFTVQTSAEYLGKDASILPPENQNTGGAEKRLKDLSRIELRDGLSILKYDETNRAGAYDVSVAGENALRMTFAVQPDPAESNLTLVSEAQIDRFSKNAQMLKYSPEMKIGELLERDRVGKELWLFIAILAITVAAIEMLLADSFSQPK